MKAVLLACEGVSIGTLWLPPFELKAGEAICLHMPSQVSQADQESMQDALTGKQILPGLRLYGKVVWAKPATNPRNFFGLLRIGRLTQPRPADWLSREAGVLSAEANAIVTRLGLQPEWKLCQLAYNPRTLLGLEAAWARGANVVLFSARGCDPVGIQQVQQAVLSRLERCAAIELCDPKNQEGAVCGHFLAGANCIELGTLSRSSMPLTTTDSRE